MLGIAGCLPDVARVKEDLLHKMDERFDECEDKMDQLAEDLAVCHQVLELLEEHEGEPTE
jgi:hypothetical protein